MARSTKKGPFVDAHLTVKIEVLNKSRLGRDSAAYSAGAPLEQIQLVSHSCSSV